MTTRDRFRELLSQGDDAFNLAEAALLIAAEREPSLDVQAYLRELDRMAAEASVYLPVRGPIRASIEGLNRYLFDDYGLIGNQVEYYDPRNSFLSDVLDRRMGIPITISVVYLEIGWRLGLPLYGIGMPGHFLLGARREDESVIVDAFNRGRECTVDQCAELITRIYGGALAFTLGMLQPATRRDIVVRMLGNLRGIAGQQRDHGESLRWSDLTVLATQGSARSLRERGAVKLVLRDFEGARQDLTEALRRAEHDDERQECQLLLNQIPPS